MAAEFGLSLRYRPRRLGLGILLLLVSTFAGVAAAAAWSQLFPAGEPGRLAQEHVSVAAHAIARIEWSESATTIRNLSVPGGITRGPPAA